LNTIPLCLCTVVPTAEITAPVSAMEKKINAVLGAMLIFIILIDLIVVALVLGSGFYLGNTIVRPINRMVEISSKLGRGEIDTSAITEKDLAPVPDMEREDEVGKLLRSFTGMVSTISKSAGEEKKRKEKEEAPIPTQLIQDIKIEIKDSIIQRSTIGGPSSTEDEIVKNKKKKKAKYCLNCGKDLPPDFEDKTCPYCKEEI
ncbi:MAG: HAMP domain-containing protein, partial [Thermoplasmata archaeon]